METQKGPYKDYSPSKRGLTRVEATGRVLMEGHRRSGGLAQLAMENGKGLEFRGLGFKGLRGFGVQGFWV